MFSVIFPGQGSQKVGMAKDLYIKHKIVNDAVHRHACDERWHKIGNDIMVQR